MEKKMDSKKMKSEVECEGSRGGWGIERKAIRKVYIFDEDADILALVDSTMAYAVHWLMCQAKVFVYRSNFAVTIADSKVLSYLQEKEHQSGSPRYVEGVQVSYPINGRLMAISFSAERLDELLDAVRLGDGDTDTFKKELRKASDGTRGGIAVAVFPLIEP
ncbi:MAG: hypothetical protein IJT88_09030 [Kiritimatiellae bacterium]|nr:hypothetical protein [Kiritimatiellia bacterium]